jgi:protein O-GlcNAc transferase
MSVEVAEIFSRDAALQEAALRHRNGDLAGAERLYEEILAVEPNFAEARHELGVLAMRSGRIAVGLRNFQLALSSDPQQGRYWLSCVAALLEAGQVESASELLAQGRECGLEGAAADVLTARLNLVPIRQEPPGAKRRNWKNPGKVKAAESSAPTSRELGLIRQLVEGGSDIQAEAEAEKLTIRYPQSSLAWELLSVVLERQGKTDASIQAIQSAVSLSPAGAEVRFNLANLLRLNDRLAEAETCYREALAIKPDYGDAHLNLGITLKAEGRAEQAELCYRRALQIDPDNVPAHSNLAIVLWHLGQLDEAESHYRRAIEIEPNRAELHSNLASLLIRRGRLAESEASCRAALLLKPGLSEAWNNLGDTLQTAGRNREAIDAYRRAIQIKSSYPEAHSNLLFCLSHDESLAPERLLAAHVEFGRHFEAPVRALWPLHGNSRDPDRRLNVGFVSGDLREHAVAFFLEPLLPHLAGHSGLSLHAYSNSFIEDAVTLRLRGSFARWRRIADIPEPALAAQIQADAIDILIDLSGHTNGNRLLTFARKPAPVQASWIGYPGTTGLEAMDYYLGDRFFLPFAGFASQFTEKIVHLPAVSPFLPAQEAPPVNPLPALTNGYLTLASFNRPGKLSRAVIGLWSRLLVAVPDARMLIGALPLDGDHSTLLKWFADEGVGAERLRLLPRSSMPEYLARHHQVDFCLDAFPYGGCTTTSHALWMGVPTLSAEGATPAGREGTTFLNHLGLEDFIAADANDFVRKGLALASQPDRLARLRAGLRERLECSALGHPEAIAEGLACALRKMWRRWCAGLPPEAF